MYKKILSASLIALAFLPLLRVPDLEVSAQTVYPVDSYAYAGKLTSCEINSNSLLLKGTVSTQKLTASSILYAYELPIYQDEKTITYSSLTPLATLSRDKIGASGEFSFTVPVGSLKSVNSKFVVSLSKQTLADCAKYITNPEILATNKDPYPQTKSIKGLQVQMNSDAERLGVQHAAINVTLNSLLTLTSHGENSIPFTFNGKKYYFVKDYVESLDATFAPLSNNHIAVNVILLLPTCDLADPDLPNKDLVHPDAKASMQNYVINAFNLTNKAGVDYYTAMMTFLSRRYNGSNPDYGTINGYIVGNEIGMRTYHNMGDKPTDEFAMEYERQLRLTSSIVKQARSSARVYVSLEHFWARTAYDYINRDLIDLINYYSKKGGDYDWNIAFHPYPDNLFDPKTWNDTNTTDSFDTEKINFKNLQVLPRYLKQTNYLFHGKPRRIILSEEGFNTPAPSFMEYQQQIQAAAYAYSYYKAVSLPEIDAFILHRHVDHTQEAGLKLGLWETQYGEVVQPGIEKYIYQVFKNIDTVDSKKVTEFALGIISENNTKNMTYTNWKQLIQEYSDSNITAKCSRPVQSTANCITGALKIKTKVQLGDSKFTGWHATDNADSGGMVPDISGDYFTAKINGVSMKDFKGFTYTPSSPVNLKGKEVLSVDVTAGNIGDSKVEYMLRAYSGDKVLEGSSAGSVGVWNTVSLDIRNFQGITSIDRIKVWARPLSGDVVWSSGSISVKNLTAAVLEEEGRSVISGSSSVHPGSSDHQSQNSSGMASNVQSGSSTNASSSLPDSENSVLLSGSDSLSSGNSSKLDAGGSDKPGDHSPLSALWIAVIAGILALLAATGGFFFFRRRKSRLKSE